MTQDEEADDPASSRDEEADKPSSSGDEEADQPASIGDDEADKPAIGGGEELIQIQQPGIGNKGGMIKVVHFLKLGKIIYLIILF